MGLGRKVHLPFTLLLTLRNGGGFWEGAGGPGLLREPAGSWSQAPS